MLISEDINIIWCDLFEKEIRIHVLWKIIENKEKTCKIKMQSDL